VAPRQPYRWTPHVTPKKPFCQQLVRMRYGRTCLAPARSPVDCASNALAVGHAPNVFGGVACSAPPCQQPDYAEATIKVQPTTCTSMSATAPVVAAVVVSSVPTDNINVAHALGERFITTAQFVDAVGRSPNPCVSWRIPAAGIQRGQL
jgi:hypothetical protein